MATISMPWNENDAWTMTVKKPRKRSRVTLFGSNPAPAKTPGFFQYCVACQHKVWFELTLTQTWKPSLWWFGAPPRSMTRPTIIKPVIIVTFEKWEVRNTK
jgi:hypothetical protein